MPRPTLVQTLLNRPSQTYSFPHHRQHCPTTHAGVAGNGPYVNITPYGGAAEAVRESTRELENKKHKTTKITSPAAGNHDSDSDSQDDVFYTPNTSPRTSVAFGPQSVPFPTAQPSTVSIETDKPVQRPRPVQASSTSTITSTSTMSTSSAASLSRCASPVTTPDSESGRFIPSPTLLTKLSGRSRRRISSVNSPLPRSTPRNRRSTIDSSSSTASSSSYKYTDEDWAREVRWLSGTTTSNIHRMVTTQQRKTTSGLMKHRTPPATMMMSMTAVLEEEEDISRVGSGSVGEAKIIDTELRPRHRIQSVGDPLSVSSSSQPQSRTALHRRRSRSLGSSHSGYFSVASISSAHPAPSQALPSNGMPGYTSLTLPRAPLSPLLALGMADKKGKGRAATVESKFRMDGSGQIDLTRSGIAQTTMATIEVVSGLSEKAGGWRSKLFSNNRWPWKEKNDGSGRDRELGLSLTSWRSPPTYVPPGGVLVQVWAVGLDTVDWRLVGSDGEEARTTFVSDKKPWLSRRGDMQPRQGKDIPSRAKTKTSTLSPSKTAKAEVGYIPGRSFVGRVLECGEEVKDEVVRRGEWVVGLLDVKKCGALAEFIIVDRHRVHRVPYPRMDASDTDGNPDNESSGSRTSPDMNDSGSVSTSHSRQSSSTPSSSSSSLKPEVSPSSKSPSSIRFLPPPVPKIPVTPPSLAKATGLTLEELALLPLVGVPAYRAVRTFAYAFRDSGTQSVGQKTGWDGSHLGVVGKHSGATEELGTWHGAGLRRGRKRRRALVLGGHDGAGAMAVQMLVKMGWRVCAHAPLPVMDNGLNSHAKIQRGRQEQGQYLEVHAAMRDIEERVQRWGADEVIFDDGGVVWESSCGENAGPATRVLERLMEENEVFDAVLDTIGGKEIWEVAGHLLAAGEDGSLQRDWEGGHFATLVGDNRWRSVPTAGDHFRAGLRSWKGGNSGKGSGRPGAEDDTESVKVGASPRSGSLRRGNLSLGRSKSLSKKGKGKVGYAWVSVAQDVDWEGEDIKESIAAVLRMAMEDGVRPFVGDEYERHGGNEVKSMRVVPFERTPDVFRSGVLVGGTSVVKVAGA